MIATASTVFRDVRVLYLFAYPRRDGQTDATVSLRDLGIRGPIFAYNWKARHGEVIAANSSLPLTFTKDAEGNAWDYQVLVPISASGIALLGDEVQIVPLGKQRVPALQENGGSVTTTVQFAPSEKKRTIIGYAARKPKIAALDGGVENTQYSPETRMFSFDVLPSKTGAAKVQLQ